MIENKILEVFRISGMSRIEFAERLNISNAVLSHLASGRNKASLDLVINILHHFPTISADWLLLNKGEMYRSGTGVNAIKENLSGYITRIKELNQMVAQSVTGLEKEVFELK